MEDSETFYTEGTALKLVEHLRKRSKCHHAIDAVDIMSDMKHYFDEAASIPVYINMMETAPKKAACAKLPISNDMLAAIYPKATMASDYFPRTSYAWKEKNDVDKTTKDSKRCGSNLTQTNLYVCAKAPAKVKKPPRNNVL